MSSRFENFKLLPDPSIVLEEPVFPPVTEMFLDQVKAGPEKTAVERAGRSWNYLELAEAAQRIAAELKALGLSRGEVAAVSGSRTFDLVAATLGVFFSGGVLLLLDPDLPILRRQQMLEQSGARWMVQVERQLAGSDGQVAIRSILERTEVILPGEAGGEIASSDRLRPDDPAYIFFTSGSTGRPKGIVGCHKGLSHFMNWQRLQFGVHPTDRVAQLTYLSFDPVLRDLFLPLTSGACLCLPPANPLWLDGVLAWLARERITIIHAVPSLMRLWLQGISPDLKLPDLKYVFFAGEMLSADLVQLLRQRCLADCRVINLYGPTETTLIKAWYEVPADPLPGSQPVGRPMPDTQLLVINPERQLCGIGEPGQIVIRTPFASLGYLDPGEADAQRFQPNWFCLADTNRLYLTGDLGYYQPDGILKVLGRMDEQVKIRGALVQPQEVMVVLGKHPGVAACFVQPQQERAGNIRLVAYVVRRAEYEPGGDLSAEIWRFLHQHFPDYMVPSAFVFLESLPLLPNGKINRKALPEPDLSQEKLQEEFVAPRNPTEEMVAGIWSEVLGLDQVGIYDNFFYLGGHSLLAIRLINKLDDLFQVQLPLRLIFEAPTVESFARVLRQVSGEPEQVDRTAQLILKLAELSESDAQDLLDERKVDPH
jgi:amino acid adenylation domain-containing protein